MNLFVSIDGNDVTGFLQNLLSDKSASTLIDLQIDDEAGGKSDKVTLKVVRDNQIALPPKGAQIIVSLPNAVGLLVPMGIYYSDAPKTSGSKQGGHLMTLCGTAADMGGALKEKRTQSYDSTTLKKVVETIAGRHSLEPVVSESLASISVLHKDQTNVSDMHFLTEWAKELGAIFKVAHDKLMFVEKGTTKKASGAQIPALQPLATQIISYEWSGAQRTEYKTVKAAYHDQDKATRLYAEAGSEEPVHTLCKTFASKAEAQKAADAALKDGIAGAQTASVTIIGDASARAEGAILLPPVQPELAGAWSIRRASHSVRKGVGYTSKLDLERVRS